MPRIAPDSPDVSWPHAEGCIGVVGVAPWATVDFCRKVYELTPATKDWHYPRLLVDANSKIPSRGRHLELGERDPSPFIQATIEELAKAGATVAVVPCNTAHILFDRWGTHTPIPTLNIVDETVRLLAGKTQITAVLGSSYLSQSQLYQHAIAAAGHSTVELNASEQNMISRCIGELKCSPILSNETHADLAKLIQRLRQASVNTVVLACTELSLLSKLPIWSPLTVIDSNEALARAALRCTTAS